MYKLLTYKMYQYTVMSIILHQTRCNFTLFITCVMFIINDLIAIVRWRTANYYLLVRWFFFYVYRFLLSRGRYGSWIYNYLCNQCLSPLKLWVRIPLRRGALDTALCDKVCLWLATGLWFSLGTPVFSTNKTDLHDITEILSKAVLNIITLTL